jgi:two-component system, OmpR family, response regulator
MAEARHLQSGVGSPDSSIIMRILVVEDEPRQAAALCEGLRDARYVVDHAADGEEALHYVSVADYDVILLDVLLPAIDGLEVCRRIRASGDQTPILILTARDATEHKVTGLDAGADDYLTKPFELAELLARVRALVRREVTQKAGVLQVGNASLDPARQEVRIGSNPVDLTVREYQILEYLMHRPGHVLSRDAIIEHVWGFDYPGTSNLIDVHVSNLRRKLAEAGEEGLIQTIRGAGYRLVDQNGAA